MFQMAVSQFYFIITGKHFSSWSVRELSEREGGGKIFRLPPQGLIPAGRIGFLSSSPFRVVISAPPNRRSLPRGISEEERGGRGGPTMRDIEAR